METLISPSLLSANFLDLKTDLEMIKTEGKSAITQVDPNMVLKKKDGKETEVQEGWMGHILPFELVQKLRLQSELDIIAQKESEVAAIQSEYEEILESIAEEDRGEFINEDGTAFVPKEIAKIINERYDYVLSLLSSKKDLLDYIAKRLLEIETMTGKEFYEIIKNSEHCQHIAEQLAGEAKAEISVLGNSDVKSESESEKSENKEETEKSNAESGESK